ncbi:hypothetical protein [Bradyrhizobium sp. Ash2021]|uniref:hypothetical protein n=1 Tax=Bradyrhizobium sp. Ash2021 TaxID=2954771 RepID=UPI002815D9C8|nr:hypothetical protein [Bradyrhizobium sp. Ash2021]WMT77403.1 hypothetical protein NL528_14070 [Bradyrhizobium sp. Ash2021]
MVSEFTHHMKEAMIVGRRIMKVTPKGENPPLDRIERVALSLVKERCRSIDARVDPFSIPDQRRAEVAKVSAKTARVAHSQTFGGLNDLQPSIALTGAVLVYVVASSVVA